MAEEGVPPDPMSQFKESDRVAKRIALEYIQAAEKANVKLRSQVPPNQYHGTSHVPSDPVHHSD